MTKDGLEIWDLRVFDEVYDSGQKTDYYAERLEELPYRINRLFLPHDGKRQTVLKDSISVEEDFIEMGFDTEVLPRPVKILPYILHTRRRLYNTRIDKSRCPQLLENLNNYKKKYDKKLEQFTSDAVHDEHSHGADAFRYLCSVPYTCEPIRKEEVQDYGYDDFHSLTSSLDFIDVGDLSI